VNKLAKLRGGVRSKGRESTRLSHDEITAWVNTWTREVQVWLNKDGRCSIVVKDGSYPNGKEIIDIEIPAQTGEYEDAFKPVVKLSTDMEIETK